jgi:hypothetical protein
MTPVEFEPTISAGERPKTNALDRGATGTEMWGSSFLNYTSGMLDNFSPFDVVFDIN